MAVEGPRGFYQDANKGNGSGYPLRQPITTEVEASQSARNDNKHGGLGGPLLPGENGREHLPMNKTPLYANVVRN